jgi:anti-sigma factor RsiW
MTDCLQNEIRDRLPGYVHGTLGSAERARVEAHLGGCAECRAEVALLRSMSAAMARGTPAVDVKRIVTAAKAARPVPKTRPELAQMPRPLPQYVWRAAAAVLFVVVGATGYYVGRARPGSGTPVQVATNPAQIYSHPMTQSPTAVPAVNPAPTQTPAPVGLSFGGGEDLSPAQANALLSDLEKSAPAIDAEPEAIIDLGSTQ